MRRTPQPTLTQAELTRNRMLQFQQHTAGYQATMNAESLNVKMAQQATAGPGTGGAPLLAATAQQVVMMDTSGPQPLQPKPPATVPAVAQQSNLVTTEFLLQTLKANTDQIIKSLMLMLMLILKSFISRKLPPKWGEAHRQVAAQFTTMVMGYLW